MLATLLRSTRLTDRTVTGLIAAVTIGLLSSAVAGGEKLDRTLLQEAPKISQFLRDQGYRNVGVLKFRVKKGNAPVTDRAGTLNLSLAERLELALILANSPADPLGIVHNASAVAATLPGASHLTSEGRPKLFAAKYPLAWGSSDVMPDAFLTGVALLDEDLRKMTIGIVAFDQRGSELTKVTQFTVAPDTEELAESGESFLVRGVFDQGQVELAQGKKVELAQAEAMESAVKVKHGTDRKQHPIDAANAQSPVALEIHYDGRLVPLEIRGGQAWVLEPREGQKVSLALKRKAKDHVRYGAVLKVNGENTVFRERLKDVHCTKWIIEPASPPLTIRGFQMTDKTAQEFRVLSPAASKAKEMDYGADVGTISLVVFRELQGGGAPPANLPQDEDLAVLSRGAFPAEQAPSFRALRARLTDLAPRGLLAEGHAIQASAKRVSFVTDPVPVMSAVITYYHP